MSHLLARPLGSLPITAEQRAVRALPGLALPVPTLMDAVLDLQPLGVYFPERQAPAALPLPDVVVDGVPVVSAAVQGVHRG